MSTQDFSAQAGARDRASYRAGFAFGTLGFFAVTAVAVVSTIVTARIYGVRIVGMSALVLAPVAALGILSTVKEQQALIREITGLPARAPRVTQLFAAVFTFSLGLTATVALLDAVVCWFVFRGPLHAPGLVAPAWVSIAGYTLVTNTAWNVDSIFAAFVAGRQLFWVRLHEALSFLAIATAAGLTWHSVWGLVIATIGASLTALVHRVLWVRRFVRARLSAAEYRIGLQVLPSLLRFGAKATPGQIAQGVSQQCGVWALGAVAPVVVVGAYSRALTIPQRLQQASTRITEVLYPTLVGRHTSGDSEGFDRAMIDSIRYEMVGMLLFAAAIGGAAHSVLQVFGPGFTRGTTALALLMLYPALAAITVTQTQAMWATNRPGRTSMISIARLIVTLALVAALTPSVGIAGPVIALLAGYGVAVLLGGVVLRPVLRRPVRTTWPLRERFALLGAYAAGFAAAHLVELTSSSLAALPASLLAGGLAYAVAFLAGGGLNARDRARGRELTTLLRSWHTRRQTASPLSAQDTTRDGARIEAEKLADPLAP
jgi:O-antigen/teichoic acid export membrane protein